jgi:hypothetical protein
MDKKTMMLIALIVAVWYFVVRDKSSSSVVAEGMYLRTGVLPEGFTIGEIPNINRLSGKLRKPSLA